MTIAERVKLLIEEHGTRNPFALCDCLDIPVTFAPLGSFRGYCLRYRNDAKITISDALGDLPSEFVCAHELGHALLHQRINRIFMDSHTHMVAGRFENEADKFAAQLLFGGPPMFADGSLSAWDMADILNVAVCNVDTRLIELGIYH